MNQKPQPIVIIAAVVVVVLVIGVIGWMTFGSRSNVPDAATIQAHQAAKKARGD